MNQIDVDGLCRELATDELRNCSIINFIRSNRLISVDRAGRSLLLRGESDAVWIYVSSDDRSELEMLARRLTREDDRYAAIEEWMIPILVGTREFVWRLPMIRFVLPADSPLPRVEGHVGTLSPADASWIYEHSNYREFISVEYATACIVGGPSAAIREEGVLVAWAMTQDDGAMGFLHVLESHRNKGFGRRIAIALANRVREAGRRPFAYISEHNDASISLVSKLGFVKDRPIEWFQLR